MKKLPGILIISLDFELHWGVLGHKSLRNYRENLLGVRTLVPNLLELFADYDIHATWATVGFLFCESRMELEASLPPERPGYGNDKLNPYLHLQYLGENEAQDPIHYAPSLLRLIHASPNQEIASHTFSHFFCLEKGQGPESFRADLTAAVNMAKKFNVTCESIVFPKNQVNRDYVALLPQFGFKAYRGNELSWLYQGRSEEAETSFRRGLRLLDAYVNLSGHHAYPRETVIGHFPLNIAASRFLRPYSRILRILEPLKLARIRGDLSYAARQGLIYHLWWHPHNFGVDQEENLDMLRKLLDHFKKLQELYGMASLNMKELAYQLLRGAKGE